jgi:hypothetical protein
MTAEESTFGDIEALASLKEKIDASSERDE